VSDRFHDSHVSGQLAQHPDHCDLDPIGSFILVLPPELRIEETANLCDQVEQSIRRQIPAGEVENVIDNIGLPYSGINLSYSNSGPVGNRMPTLW